MQQDLEEEKNKTIIKDLEEKVENYEAVLKKKDFAIQDLEIMAKEHEGALEKKDFVIHCSNNQKNLSRKRNTLKQVLKLRWRRIQICKNP
jgi:hypothetical protein